MIAIGPNGGPHGPMGPMGSMGPNVYPLVLMASTASPMNPMGPHGPQGRWVPWVPWAAGRWVPWVPMEQVSTRWAAGCTNLAMHVIAQLNCFFFFLGVGGWIAFFLFVVFFWRGQSGWANKNKNVHRHNKKDWKFRQKLMKKENLKEFGKT